MTTLLAASPIEVPANPFPDTLRCDRPLAFYMPSLAGGGAERMTLTLIRALMERGARITLLLSQAGGALAGDVPAGCAVVAFGTRRTALDLLPLTRWLRANRPDVLFSSIHHNNLVAMAAKSLAGPPTRLVITLHNALSSEAGSGAPLGYRIVPALYRLGCGAADGIVAVSDGVAGDMASAAGVRRPGITVLHNPIIDARFAALASAAAAHPWCHDKTVPLFVTAGRLVAQKDHATLLHALQQRQADGPARLLILGEGPERGPLEALARRLGIAPRVAFAGFLANPLPAIREASAFVLSSRYEGFGNVLVEAMGCGTPVIAADCPYGPAEVLGHGAYGQLVRPGDAAALAGAMRGDHRARWPAPALRARAAEFASGPIAGGYVRFIERVMDGWGRAGPGEGLAS